MIEKPFSEQSSDVELVKGRECGECSVCCIVLNVDTPEFQKMPRTPCAHLRGRGGCMIHGTRFPVCRSYFCAWRHIAKLGDDWRPDRSGILIDFQTDGLPPEYPARPGVRLTVVGMLHALFRSKVLYYIAKMIERGVPVVLAVPGPPGHFAASIILNSILTASVSARDLNGVEVALRSALKGLGNHIFEPVVHKNQEPKRRAPGPH